MPELTLDAFTDATVAVLREGSVGDYAPTLVADDEIRVLEGIPDDIDHRDAVQTALQGMATPGKTYLFGVRTGTNEVTTGEVSRSARRFKLIEEFADGYVVTDLESCPWWRLALE